MTAYVLYLITAFYLGVVTSISPCPLATNIAAISYIARKVGTPRLVINAGWLYTLGRCALYVGLASLLTATALSIPSAARFLQQYGGMVLGPVFLLVGMFLVGLITSSAGGTLMSPRMQRRVDAMGIWGALLMGILFAASFCPTSVIWFFGLLAITMGSTSSAITVALAKVGIALPTATVPGGVVILPLVYGIGTAVPVIVVAFLLAYSAQSVGKAYNIMAAVEWGARMLTGWLFILLGIWFVLTQVF